MKRLNSEISIGDETFRFVNELEISSSWETFTDTAKIRLPNRFVRDNQTITVGVDNLFKRGDAVTIKLGYFPNLVPIYQGFVSKVLPDSPLVIECEDAMWLLKQKTITASFKNTELSQLLSAVVPSIVPVNSNIDDAKLGQFRITRVSIAQVLEELKKTYGLVSFVRDGTLEVGLAYPFLPAVHDITFEDDITVSNLEYRCEENLRIKIKGISMRPDNTKIEVDAGDIDGETRTLTYYDLDKAELTAIVNRELPKFKFTGYFGSFDTFGEPVIKHGDQINLVHKKFPEKNGVYLVSTVNTTFGMSGYKQSVSLDIKVSV